MFMRVTILCRSFRKKYHQEAAIISGVVCAHLCPLDLSGGAFVESNAIQDIWKSA